MMRLSAAFLFAALWLPVFMAVVDPGYDFFWSKMTAPFTVLCTVLVALPGYLIFRDRITFLHCLLGGAAAGLSGSAFFLLLTSWAALVKTGPLMMAVGLLTGMGFWLVAFAGVKRGASAGSRQGDESVLQD